jgi:transcriptional regulator with XRE-family HTH domain
MPPKRSALGAVSPEAAFGRVLQRFRLARELSQDELAHVSGYHRTYISLLERGIKAPSLPTLINLASALRISPSKLVLHVEREMAPRRRSEGS